MLLRGNSENARPNRGPGAGISKYKKIAERRGLSGLDRQRFYRSEALKWMLKNKGKTVKLYFQKFLTHFHFRNELGTGGGNNVWRDVVMFVSYYMLLILAIARMFVGGSLKGRPFEVFAVMCYVIMGAAYAIFFTRIRYRLPVDWMLISMAAIQAGCLLKGFKDRTGT